MDKYQCAAAFVAVAVMTPLRPLKFISSKFPQGRSTHGVANICSHGLVNRPSHCNAYPKKNPLRKKQEENGDEN